MRIIIAAVMSSLVATQAMAVIGLPYAERATTTAGEMSVQGGITLESDLNMFGGRVNYGIMDGVSVFAGGGIFDWDHVRDSELYLQGGGKYTLPLDLPVDLAIRGAVGYVSFSGANIMTINGGVLASADLDPMITVYGFGGLSHARTSVSHGRDSSDTELALAGGALFNITENLSLYAELAHIDELFISGGAKFRFGGL